MPPEGRTLILGDASPAPTRRPAVRRRVARSTVAAPPAAVPASTSARAHWRENLSSRDLARPASSGDGAQAVMLLLIVAIIASAALAASGTL